jgi:hypothetical protein
VKLAEAGGLFLAFLARLITGAQGHWHGCPPKAEQRRFDLFTVFIPVYVFLAIAVVGAFGNDPQRFFERAATFGL